MMHKGTFPRATRYRTPTDLLTELWIGGSGSTFLTSSAPWSRSPHYTSLAPTTPHVDLRSILQPGARDSSRDRLRAHIKLTFHDDGNSPFASCADELYSTVHSTRLDCRRTNCLRRRSHQFRQWSMRFTRYCYDDRFLSSLCRYDMTVRPRETI